MNPLQRAALALEAANRIVSNTTSDLDAAFKARMVHQQSLDGAATDQAKRMLDEFAAEPLGQLSKEVPCARSAKYTREQLQNGHSDAKIEVARASEHITVLPLPLGRKFTGLPKDQHALLLAKQQKLLALKARASAQTSALTSAIDATLIFAQDSAGTAVCIAPSGLLLTCSHCISEDPDGPEENETSLLIFSAGRIVQTKCIAFDLTRDLALLQIIAAQPPVPERLLPSPIPTPPTKPDFPAVTLSRTRPKPRFPLACIGHPGSEDLENPLGGATDYPILSVSKGRYRGLANGQNVQDNSEIGALQHDCWTYWGHSGAPLVDEKTGDLVGLHSSWDEMSGMRRGVAWDAVREFLKERMGGTVGVSEGVCD